MFICLTLELYGVAASHLNQNLYHGFTKQLEVK